ncbi:rhodanese-like domain-containing protein [Sapientia aquatica]|uniref:Rhodanese-like domain-containing protein n=1 Tax=Sapientia aquatica TaxID=1549640 RepID=A0A4R5W390_9BURK|nr:rhodanese-like domain-containing protein [Sapientia aquatica]TDK66487.1 rhodanese-like domain-containing protein [Sapientia aquatica]
MSESTQFSPNSSFQESGHFASDPASQTASHADQDLLDQARQQGQAQQLPFAGTVTPIQAWQLVQDGVAQLVDVRTAEERKFVGEVPNSWHVAWMTGLSMNRNPRFVKEFEVKLKDKNVVALLLCRSGKRSSAAAEALTKAGFTNIFNIEGGFEGDINDDKQRGSLGGWRFHSLPWIQD